jgi:hypothetical protein
VSTFWGQDHAQTAALRLLFVRRLARALACSGTQPQAHHRLKWRTVKEQIEKLVVPVVSLTEKNHEREA